MEQAGIGGQSLLLSLLRGEVVDDPMHIGRVALQPETAQFSR